jgi:hypothetical protein
LRRTTLKAAARTAAWRSEDERIRITHHLRPAESQMRVRNKRTGRLLRGPTAVQTNDEEEIGDVQLNDQQRTPLAESLFLGGGELSELMRALDWHSTPLGVWRTPGRNGYSRNAIVDHGCLDAGVHLLTKPFTFEQLAARVREILDCTP